MKADPAHLRFRNPERQLVQSLGRAWFHTGYRLVMAEAGVYIAVLHSDHDQNLIIISDDHAKAERLAYSWMHDNWGND